MYDWQQNRSMTSPLVPGQLVKLNPNWGAYDYLKQHFGHFFPAYVSAVSYDGIVKIGDKKPPFARQVLTPA